MNQVYISNHKTLSTAAHLLDIWIPELEGRREPVLDKVDFGANEKEDGLGDNEEPDAVLLNDFVEGPRSRDVGEGVDLTGAALLVNANFEKLRMRRVF